MAQFTIYPAIDLRGGQVVRLKEGDPDRQTNYSTSPGEVARRWLDAGASWLHVINLDGAFGAADSLNRAALTEILTIAAEYGAKIQFGGGLRSADAVHQLLEMGVWRAILGTMAIQQPEVVSGLLVRWGDQRITVSLDGREGVVTVKGWQENTELTVLETARQFKAAGLKMIVFTDIGRDGLQTGVNMEATAALAQNSGLEVVASGGVGGWADIKGAYDENLAGVIVGRALYENVFDPQQLFRFPDQPSQEV
jgi:phosphoribosylformimino-5-aminoimidazole carboxamide ribotide isomerase